MRCVQCVLASVKRNQYKDVSLVSTPMSSLVPRPCGGGKKRPGIDCLRMRGCPTICGGQDLYVYSPCNVGRYITCTLPHIVSRVLNGGVRF